MAQLHTFTTSYLLWISALFICSLAKRIVQRKMVKGLLSFIAGFITSDVGEEIRHRFCRSVNDTLSGATLNPHLEELRISHQLIETIKKQEIHVEDLQQTITKLYNYMVIIYAASSAIIALVCLSSICCYLIGIRRERRSRLESHNEEMKQRIQELEREAAKVRDDAQRLVPQERPLMLSIPGLASNNNTAIPVTNLS
mmetsp:Transcript_21474/g.44175  ORF Transcript_21474/g.44175 Transcript_21474/m.44175 type:complete len:198 (-) Transcript_21474:1978-2571(-)